MTTTDWFRHTSWSPTIREQFYKRLKRSRTHNQAQYLRIQAWTLEQAGQFRPAIDLIDDMLQLFPDDLQLASAHVVRAKCFVGLGLHNEATAEFRLACDRERSYPHIQVSAALEFAEFVHRTNQRALITEVLSNLDEFERNRSAMFPIQRYLLEGFRAVFLQHLHKKVQAKQAARRALDAAGSENSGFRNHPKLGLVADVDNMLKEQILQIAAT
jgi:hypothetical protein